MWARCMEGVRKAAAHCSNTVGSHSWWRTEAARFPAFWSSHSASRRRANPHSWDWAEQAQRWGAVSGCAPQRRHVVSSTLSRWEDRCARTAIVGMLSMRCAVMWRCWSLSNQSRGSPLPGVYLAGPCRYGGPILQPIAQRRWGELALVAVGHRGEEGEGAPEEPRQVYLWRLLRRCIKPDV